MPSPEKILLERKKEILLAAAVITLGSLALKKNKVVGDKIFHASFWPASQSVMADVISDSKDIAGRIAAKVIRNAAGEVVDVEPIATDQEPSEATLIEYEREIVKNRLEVTS